MTAAELVSSNPDGAAEAIEATIKAIDDFRGSGADPLNALSKIAQVLADAGLDVKALD